MIDPLKPDYGNTPASDVRPDFQYRLWDEKLEPVVSICTPYYNTGPVIHETAKSIFLQTLQQWEWIIFNDGSSDPEALEALNVYRSLDRRIKVIDAETNRGLPGARNGAIAGATTDYIYMIDSDDLIEPTALEKSYWFLKTHPEYAFVSGYSIGFGATEYLWTRGFHERDAFLYENLATGRCMLRKSVHTEVGRHDEESKGGWDDWDFWLRCANRGYWGSVIPEYLDWYRWRPNHVQKWSDWSTKEAQQKFKEDLRRKYPDLYAGKFPKIDEKWPVPYETVPDETPTVNHLEKSKVQKRALILVPWFTMGGADKFTLDLLKQMSDRGWQVTLVATLRGGDLTWMPEFAKYTPDIFVLHNFLRPVDHPRFLRYLMESRRPDLVMVTQSELGYLLLPYLRASYPSATYVDFTHIEEEYWKNGGYPRYAVGCQSLLDMNMVTSEHLKGWMVKRGADPKKIEVSYINVDPDLWCRKDEKREWMRGNYGIAENEVVVMFAGRITAQKQPRVLAGTIKRLAEQASSFRFIIAGDGEDGPWFREYLKKHHLQGKVVMLGSVRSDAVRDHMMAADIFFLPSLWEGIALSVYESMSMGLAVVGANVGGQRELVTSDCGIMIERSTEQEEIEEYAEVLKKLIADPAACRTMGARARSRIEKHFRLEQMGDRMISLFEAASRIHDASAGHIVDRRFALECATRAIEYVRVNDLAEWLWREREGLSRAAPPAATNGRRALSIEEEVRLIENSISWRFYKLMSSVRLVEPLNGDSKDPSARLKMITSTKYYQRVQAFRRNKLYRIYESVRRRK